MVVCKFCGHEELEGSRFCFNCGMPIDYNESEELKFTEETYKREKRKKQEAIINKTVGYLMFFFFIIVSCFFVYILFFSDFNKSRDLESFNNEIFNDSSNLLECKPKIFVGTSFKANSYNIIFNDIIIVDKTASNSKFYSLSNNREYVLLDITIENLSYSDVVYSPITNFHSYLDGESIGVSRSGILAEGLTSLEGLVQRKSSRNGFLAYYVPSDWKELQIDLGIDNLDNEGTLYIENPKNRIISDDELSLIWEKYDILDFLYDNDLEYLSDDEINSYIIDFMHSFSIDRHDIFSLNDLYDYVKRVQK